MALTKNTKVETNLYEIEFTVDAATFEAAQQKVYLKDLSLDDGGFDGTQFACEYRRSRLQSKK